MLNTEKVLQKVLQLVNAVNPRDNGERTECDFYAYRALKEYVVEELRLAFAKQKGGNLEKTRVQTARALLEKIRKEAAPQTRWVFQNSWIKDGRQYFTDGVSAYRFAEGHYLDEFPMAPAGAIAADKSAAKTAAELEKFFDETDLVSHETEVYQVNQTELKTAIAMWKAEGRPGGLRLPYPVGELDYNAEVLLTALKLLGVEETALKQRGPEEIIHEVESGAAFKIFSYSPARLTTEGRDALIMPLGSLKEKRYEEEKKKKRQEEEEEREKRYQEEEKRCQEEEEDGNAE